MIIKYAHNSRDYFTYDGNFKYSTLSFEQNGCHLANNILKSCILIVQWTTVITITSLGTKPLPQPILIDFSKIWSAYKQVFEVNTFAMLSNHQFKPGASEFRDKRVNRIKPGKVIIWSFWCHPITICDRHCLSHIWSCHSFKIGCWGQSSGNICHWLSLFEKWNAYCESDWINSKGNNLSKFWNIHKSCQWLGARLQ